VFTIFMVWFAFREEGQWMDKSEALAIVEKAWDRWVAGDLDGLLEYFNPDGVLITSGRSQVSGEARGHDAIRDWAHRLFQIAEGDFKAAPTEMAAVNDTTVLVRFGVEAHRADASINHFALQRVSFENGKLAEVYNVYADQYQFDAFFK
jgi:ketosteroid isomerase-like protein